MLHWQLSSFSNYFKKISYSPQGKEQKEDFAIFSRPFKCTCCCCNRPQLTGNYKSNNSYIGTVSEPCTICDPKIYVANSSKQITYTITCNCCQCGYCCRDACIGKCSQVHFDIFSSTNCSGSPCGSIHKIVKGLKSVIGDAGCYKLSFPPKASEEKLMLLASVIMLDYLYYEDKDKEEEKHPQK